MTGRLVAAAGAVFLFAGLAQAADLDLALTIEPAAGRATVAATIHAQASSFTLPAELALSDLTIDGRPVARAPAYPLVPGKPAEIRYAFTLPRLKDASDL